MASRIRKLNKHLIFVICARNGKSENMKWLLKKKNTHMMQQQLVCSTKRRLRKYEMVI